jgi:hypothetical protein
MKEIAIGSVRYRIFANNREGQWFARAQRTDSGDRFGIECTGASSDEAIERMARWLEWQHEHAAALDDLQRAEHAYHRTIAGSAFVGPTEGPSAAEMQKDALDAVESARLRLDEVRARRPDVQDATQKDI